MNENELYHHGKNGQKWYVRNGPPYPLYRQPRFANMSSSEYKEFINKKKNPTSNSETQIPKQVSDYYNKKHVDKYLKTSDTLNTLSFNKDRLKNAEMFYTTFNKTDQHQYKAMFNRKSPQNIVDDNGEVIGTGMFYKYQIRSKVSEDIKVASEDSGIDAFAKLYDTSKDFNNFVNDRMEELFVKNKYKFRGYKEVKDTLEKMKYPEYKVTEDDKAKLYRMFNYVLPNDGNGNEKVGKDIAKQRARFFKELKSKGYGAVLDTNDSLYGGYKAHAPTIVFDMEKVIPVDVRRLNTLDKRYSELAYAGRKLLHL